MLTLEPETLDDTLSLVLVADSALGEIGDNSPEAMSIIERALAADEARDTATDNDGGMDTLAEIERIEAALGATIRGLFCAGARSLLFEKYYTKPKPVDPC